MQPFGQAPFSPHNVPTNPALLLMIRCAHMRTLARNKNILAKEQCQACFPMMTILATPLQHSERHIIPTMSNHAIVALDWSAVQAVPVVKLIDPLLSRTEA
eukprot:2516601-Amphidinium_carterae.1